MVLWLVRFGLLFTDGCWRVLAARLFFFAAVVDFSLKNYVRKGDDKIKLAKPAPLAVRPRPTPLRVGVAVCVWGACAVWWTNCLCAVPFSRTG